MKYKSVQYYYWVYRSFWSLWIFPSIDTKSITAVSWDSVKSFDMKSVLYLEMWRAADLGSSSCWSFSLEWLSFLSPCVNSSSSFEIQLKNDLIMVFCYFTSHQDSWFLPPVVIRVLCVNSISVYYYSSFLSFSSPDDKCLECRDQGFSFVNL